RLWIGKITPWLISKKTLRKMNKSISQLAVGFLPCLIRFLMDKGPLLPKCSWEARRSLPWAHWKYLAEDASCL
ncbi:unnamed protein product, partial [Musa acuminata var. zebrina]